MSGQATFATVTCVFGGTRTTSWQYKVEWYSCTDLNFLRLPTALLQFLTDHFGVNVRLATKNVRHVYTFRCHPAYQSGSAIYNWMNAKFNKNSICPIGSSCGIGSQSKQSWTSWFGCSGSCQTFSHWFRLINGMELVKHEPVDFTLNNWFSLFCDFY